MENQCTYHEITPYLEANFDEVAGFDFYRDIFPDNENAGELNNDYSKSNAVYLYRDEKDIGTGRSLRRRIMLNDTWVDDYQEFVEENPSTLCGGLSYFGRANLLENAHKIHALIFDLDGVGLAELQNVMLRASFGHDRIRSIPVPTYIVASGGGLHLYYVLEEPIDLYPFIKLQFKALKYALTFRMWDFKGTSRLKEVQYQGINQGFRMVGSVNNKYNTPIRAYKVGQRVTLEYLNNYTKKDNRVDLEKRYKPTKMTLKEAQVQFPKWYEKVIVKGEQPKWDIASKQGDALYRWWLKKLEEPVGGHRYHYMMCLAIYAVKCDVPKAKLKKDLERIFPTLANIEHNAPLTISDMKSALEAYDKGYYNYSIKEIELLSGFRIERNRRNYRTRAEHVKFMNLVRDNLVYPDGGWRNQNGVPTKQRIVAEYRRKNPNETNMAKVARELNISRPTVYKWWKSV